MSDHKITIIQDTREQCGYDFAKYPEVVCETGTLDTGDYSLPGFTDKIAIERKTIDDPRRMLEPGPGAISKGDGPRPQL